MFERSKLKRIQSQKKDLSVQVNDYFKKYFLQRDCTLKKCAPLFRLFGM